MSASDSASVAIATSSGSTNIVLFGMFIIFMVMFGFAVVGIILWKYSSHCSSKSTSPSSFETFETFETFENFETFKTIKTMPNWFSYKLPILFPFAQSYQVDKTTCKNVDDYIKKLILETTGVNDKSKFERIQEQITTSLAKIQVLEKAEQDRTHKEKVAIEIGEIDKMLIREPSILSFDKELTNGAIDYLYVKFPNLERTEQKNRQGVITQWSFKIRETNVSN